MTKKSLAFVLLGALLVAPGLLVAANGVTDPGVQAPQGGSGSLSFFRTQTVFGDVVAAGVGLFGTGTGVINLTSVPPGATVVQAYLYWVTVGGAGAATAPTLDGQAVAGTLIGSAGDTCRGSTGNFAYRAAVTSLVPGNGSYTVAGLPSNLGAGEDSQGASLVVLWQVGSPGFPERSVLIHDGSAVIGAPGEVVSDTMSNYATSLATPDSRLTVLIGDGQDAAAELRFDGNLLADPAADASDGDMWDTDSYDVTGDVSGAPVTVSLGIPNGGDCLVLAADILSVETGAVRSIQSVPTLGGWGLAALALALLGGAALIFARRRNATRVG